MISLQLRSAPLPISEPLVMRLNSAKGPDLSNCSNHDAHLIDFEGETAEYEFRGFSIYVNCQNPEELDGDVVMLTPGRNILHRLIRKTSAHNTLLITEQCDQKCIMCSQPPKELHVDLFDAFSEAILLAPFETTIGLSGGEPMLHKARLFEFIAKANLARPDLRFHVLTNGQHFEPSDLAALKNIELSTVLWGIPVFAADPDVHDKIVVKSGAHAKLHESLALLGSVGADIELRTVVMRTNVNGLPQLATHLATHVPYAHFWAMMQMENIGYARMNWDTEFSDNSRNFSPIGQAISLAVTKGLETTLYNFPLCTIPEPYRRYSVRSISDWKQKYLPVCEACNMRTSCGGFFQWYPEAKGFAEIKAL
jgi:His-Xaa-Ser system radical SAM maturase HxsC